MEPIPAIVQQQPIQSLVVEIRGHLCDAANAEVRFNKLRLQAGQKLLQLRKRVEAGEVGDVTWWGWFEGQGLGSRSNAEKLLRMAAADDPEAALEHEQQRVREAVARTAAKKKAALANAVETYILEDDILLPSLEEFDGALAEIERWMRGLVHMTGEGLPSLTAQRARGFGERLEALLIKIERVRAALPNNAEPAAAEPMIMTLCGTPICTLKDFEAQQKEDRRRAKKPCRKCHGTGTITGKTSTQFDCDCRRGDQ
jgi:hypothetical protein